MIWIIYNLMRTAFTVMINIKLTKKLIYCMEQFRKYLSYHYYYSTNIYKFKSKIFPESIYFPIYPQYLSLFILPHQSHIAPAYYRIFAPKLVKITPAKKNFGTWT